MKNGNPNPSELAPDADLQNALLAAFGEDALTWLDEEKTQFEVAAASRTDSDPNAEPVDLRASDTTTSDLTIQSLLEQLSEDCISVDSIDAGRDAQDVASSNQQTNLPRHVVFEVGGQAFAIPLSGVREIDRCGRVTSLPRTPDWLRGVTNLRGKIVSVTDFRRLLGLAGDRQVVGEKIIVVHSDQHDARTALAVERVLGIKPLRRNPDLLSAISGTFAAYADGVAVEGENTTIMINPDRLLGSSDLSEFAR